MLSILGRVCPSGNLNIHRKIDQLKEVLVFRGKIFFWAFVKEMFTKFCSSWILGFVINVEGHEKIGFRDSSSHAILRVIKQAGKYQDPKYI